VAEVVPVAADLTGRTFGRLTIVGPAGEDLPVVAGGWWLASCVCGREMVAPAEAFLARRLQSCGRPTPEQRVELDQRLAATHPPPRW
jgi:hypothetical protein